MAVSVLQLQPSPSTYPYSMPLTFTIGGASATELRKRTTSFSSPATGSTRPRKRLHRTESILDLTLLARPPAVAAPAAYATPFTTPPSVPSDGLSRALVLPTPASSCSACGPAHPPPPSARTRSKPKAPADLHRRALTACMRESPEGEKILRMGARLAVEIMSATKELERLCGSAENDLLGDEDAMGEIDEDDVAAVEAMEEDVDMEDVERELTPEPEPEPVMSASWVVVGGQSLSCGREIAAHYSQREDWEMVAIDCAA
ncbi:hypothetical protein C8F01DRAFT_1257357 [Mycena amicta]|nr:hypothetical protein C8F01DRAFT_1257357 [Mycena amicta]